MRFEVRTIDGQLASFEVPDDDNFLIGVYREDGLALVGVDFQPGGYAAVIGHWPDGEEWVRIASVHPVVVD